MLAEVMLVVQLLLHPGLVLAELERMEVHERDLFEDDRVMNGLVRILAPREGAMAVDEDGWNRRRILARERLDDHVAGLLFLFARCFFRGHFARTGNLSVEVVARVVPSGATPTPACAKLVAQRLCV